MIVLIYSSSVSVYSKICNISHKVTSQIDMRYMSAFQGFLHLWGKHRSTQILEYLIVVLLFWASCLKYLKIKVSFSVGKNKLLQIYQKLLY